VPDITPQQLLDLPLPANDSGATTVRGYLIALLTEVWTDGEGFSGKRPFGNSGWETDLYIPMIRAGIIGGTFDDESGYYLMTCDRQAGHALILGAIAALGEAGHLNAIAASLDAENGPGPRTTVQWAVAYGGDDPNECAGVMEYDDQGAAEEQLQWTVAGFLASRAVTVWPWRRTDAEVPGA
jgi:hypothetical protein